MPVHFSAPDDSGRQQALVIVSRILLLVLLPLLLLWIHAIAIASNEARFEAATTGNAMLVGGAEQTATLIDREWASGFSVLIFAERAQWR